MALTPTMAHNHSMHNHGMNNIAAVATMATILSNITIGSGNDTSHIDPTKSPATGHANHGTDHAGHGTSHSGHSGHDHSDHGVDSGGHGSEHDTDEATDHETGHGTDHGGHSTDHAGHGVDHTDTDDGHDMHHGDHGQNATKSNGHGMDHRDDHGDQDKHHGDHDQNDGKDTGHDGHGTDDAKHEHDHVDHDKHHGDHDQNGGKDTGHDGHGTGHTGHGTDHGTGHASHDMKMYFHFDLPVYLLFFDLAVVTQEQLAGACVAIAIISGLYEGLKASREYLLRKSLKGERRKLIKARNKGEDISARSQSCARKMCNWWHLLFSLYQVVQTTLGMFLMLIYMTFHVWLCVAVSLGSGLGYFLFSWNKRSVNDFDEDHCG